MKPCCLEYNPDIRTELAHPYSADIIWRIQCIKCGKIETDKNIRILWKKWYKTNRK